MKTHEIKIDIDPFDAVASGRKTFEVRYNDREYQAGYKVIMCDYDMREIRADIGYVTGFSQKDNWVVFSLLNVEVRK